MNHAMNCGATVAFWMVEQVLWMALASPVWLGSEAASAFCIDPSCGCGGGDAIGLGAILVLLELLSGILAFKVMANLDPFLR